MLHLAAVVKHICCNLPCCLLQLTPLAVTTYPAGCYNLPCCLLQLTPLAVTTYPAGCYNLPRCLLQLTPLAVTTYSAGCYNLLRIGVNCHSLGDLIKHTIVQTCIAIGLYALAIVGRSWFRWHYNSFDRVTIRTEISCFCYNHLPYIVLDGFI